MCLYILYLNTRARVNKGPMGQPFKKLDKRIFNKQDKTRLVFDFSNSKSKLILLLDFKIWLGLNFFLFQILLFQGLCNDSMVA